MSDEVLLGSLLAEKLELQSSLSLSPNYIPKNFALYCLYSVKKKNKTNNENDHLGSCPYKPVLSCTRVVSYFLLLYWGVIQFL